MTTKYSVRKQFHRELTSWSLLAFALAALEGGVAGVLVNHFFSAVVDEFWLNQAVALVAGAPAIANLSSPFWARMEQGRNKVLMVSVLSILCSVSILFFVLSPTGRTGLFLAVLGSLVGRICWTGVLTVRSTLWRANYPRYIRAKITASLALPMSLIMALTGLAIGWISQHSLTGIRWFYLVLSILGISGAFIYRSLQIRGAENLAHDEINIKKSEGGFSWHTLITILRKDKAYRGYMRTMFIFGSGNLMFMAPLILILNHQLLIPQWQQVLITSSVPLAALPLTIKLWAKSLNKLHIIQYRAIHSWSFVLAIGIYTLASILNAPWLLWPASFTFGTAVAGAVLGWNLGHHDFTTAERASQYMAVHVTLTGVRGLIMPIIGVNLYHLLNNISVDYGRYMLILPLLLSFSGALAFVRMARKN
ncbi:MAG TPA: MFS transporter [Aeromonadales bacterium]|nr:MFS transporter [Aeromonadales bacterium]